MFKKFLLVGLLAGSALITGCAMQPVVPVDATETISIPGQSQRDIYKKIRQWFSQYFVSGKSVVDYENPEAGTIIGNGIAQIGSTLGVVVNSIHYNIRIDTKDEKFRVVTKIIKHTNTDSDSTYDVSNVTSGRNAAALAHVATIVADIKKYVTNTKHDPSW
ncbi:MAG: DUF4468 domain-containing protein [Methylobacter sp.]|nr:DUF4468 domain-containing protein [Methylobacter sp.]